MMKTMKSYELAWNRHDVARVVAYFQPNGTYINPVAGRLSGPAMTGWLQGLFAAIPDFKVETVSANPLGDRMIVSQWVIKGTWTQPFPSGPLAGAKPTGKSFTVAGASFYEWKDGNFSSETANFDQLAFLTQIGATGQK
jgi:predicted ester cyclase